MLKRVGPRSVGQALFLLFWIVIAVYLSDRRSRIECEEALENLRNLPLHGVVSERYIDRANHNLRYTVIRQADRLDKYLERDMFESLTVGDSLWKPAGTLTTKVIGKDGNLRSFTFRECD